MAMSLSEERDGCANQAFVTNPKVGQLAFLKARHRAPAQVEDRIRHAKDTGLGRFPEVSELAREAGIFDAFETAPESDGIEASWTRERGSGRSYGRRRRRS